MANGNRPYRWLGMSGSPLAWGLSLPSRAYCAPGMCPSRDIRCSYTRCFAFFRSASGMTLRCRGMASQRRWRPGSGRGPGKWGTVIARFSGSAWLGTGTAAEVPSRARPRTGSGGSEKHAGCAANADLTRRRDLRSVRSRHHTGRPTTGLRLWPHPRTAPTAPRPGRRMPC